MVAPEVRQKLKEAFLNRSLGVTSVDEYGAVKSHSITAVLKHFTPHKLAYVVTSSHGSVTVTGDHSLFILHEGVPVAVKAEQLKVQDNLAYVVEGLLTSAVVLSIQVRDYPLVYSYDLSVPGPENFVLSNGLLAHNSYSIGGVNLDLDKASKYESAYQSASDSWDKQLEKAKATVNHTAGLQQPRYGMGIRSSFGPSLGNGVLTPGKFTGF